MRFTMRSLLIAAVAALLIVSVGCDQGGSDPGAVLLRVANESGVEFQSVLLRFPAVEATYGPVAAGETSDYRPLEGAYRYGYIEVEAADETYVLQPVDFVGEEPLDSGLYTNILDIEDGRLRFELVE